MALDPSISLDVKPPTITNPIDSVTKALTLRDLMAQGQLRQQQVLQSQAQTADLQAQQQQRQVDLQDQQTFQKGMQDPATQARVAKGDFSDFEGKMQEKNLDPLRTSRATYLQNLTRQNTEDLTNSKTALSSVASAINGLKVFRNDDGTLDLNKVNDALPGTLATLTPSLKALKFDPSQLPKTITDESQLDALGGHIGATLEMHNQALAMQEAAQKAAGAASTAQTEAAKVLPAQIQSAVSSMPNTKPEEDTAGWQTWLKQQSPQVQAIAPKTSADIDAFKQRAVPVAEQPGYQIKSKELDLMNHPENGMDAIDAMSKPGTQFNTGLKSAYKAATTTEQRQAVLTKGLQQLGELDPRLAAQRIAQAVGEEKALGPLKIAQQVAVAKQLRAGDNPAVQHVAPAAISAVQNEASKIDNEYAQAKGATDEMNEVINLARKGNVLSYSYAPVTGVLTVNKTTGGSQRINMSEIAKYGGSGSVEDTVKGYLGGKLEGKSIDSRVLNDMQKFHQGIEQTAFQKYVGRLDSLNERSQAQFEPTISNPNPDIIPVKVPGHPVEFIHAANADEAKRRAPNARIGSLTGRTDAPGANQ